MADIKPFLAFRPKVGLEKEIAALPYDVYNREEALEIVNENPFSFLAIDRAETQFSEDVDTYDARVYDKAKEMLWTQIEDGRFTQEEKACYYLYEQVMNGRSQTGIVACASIDDYQNNIIKKHENTRVDKEQDRIRHVDVCGMQTGPIFLAYRSNEQLQKIISEKKLSQQPIYDFAADDCVAHRVWIIDEDEIIEQIKSIFSLYDKIYIADGHHRCASAVKVGLKRRDTLTTYQGEEEFNYFLAVLFPADELHILDYNRVVKDLNGLEKEEFLEVIKDSFLVEEKGQEAVSPVNKGIFGMYLEDTWYQLTIKESIVNAAGNDPIRSLDVSMLQEHLLNKVLGIRDPTIDKRIDFVGGIRGLKELERRVHLDMKVAFSMYPTSIYELFEVADQGLLMPPKSTWFEPKLRSGLFLHEINCNNSEPCKNI